ncbi:MAG: diadenylate cyclase [Planctomycetes bacterium]|nr:diadenylate cyclase [Planctomycetota bacterium]
MVDFLIDYVKRMTQNNSWWVFEYLQRVAHNNSWWVVVVELVLIGLIVYWLVDFLEGTRGERLFRGVIFILVVGVLVLQLIVEQFALVRVQYLYKGFLIGVLIVAVAAFQPELRRVLIRIGQPRLWQNTSHQVSHTVEALVTAATQLSAAKIGAIVVIEGQVALGEFIDTGVKLDARVSADLLKTIFHPGTTLHDMAVVIRNDRIVAARVQLPLAEAGAVKVGAEEDASPDTILHGDLGSRHRAAIGIATGSDALCLVVSEESGAISVAKDGGLTRNITENQLRAHLTGTMTQAPPVTFKSGIGRLFTRRVRREKQAV